LLLVDIFCETLLTILESDALVSWKLFLLFILFFAQAAADRHALVFALNYAQINRFSLFGM
jgi:hypothetical protein